MPEKLKTSIGGQALIEGIMMLGPKKSAIVVRTPNGLETKLEDRKILKDKHPILGWPFIRGVVNFVYSQYVGIKALMWSAEFSLDEAGADEEPGKFEKWLELKFGEKTAENFLLGIAVLLGVLLPIGLFILLPTFITGLFRGVITSGLLKNIVEGLMKIVIFVIYLVLISKMKEMRRVFEYHGAEHKSIACYEAGLELTPENAAACRKEHPRCGTSLLFMVLIISIILSSFISWSNILIRMSLRILLIPVVVAVSYEISKYIGKNDNIFTRFLRAPGLWLQKLTTQEPDEGMLEVAITALKLVIPEEEGLDKW